MPIAELLDPARVVFGLRVPDKARLLEQLARRAASELALEQESVLQELRKREELGSTGLGRGFALPHARIGSLSNAFTLFVRLAKPIEFQAIDGRPVDLVALLLTPQAADNQHLAILAALSRPFRDEAFVQSLRQAADAAAFYACLSKGYSPDND